MTGTLLAPDPVSRTVARRPVTGRPTRGDLLDAASLLALSGVALWGFRTTFDSPRFLLVGLAGVALGIGVAHLATTLRQHWLVVGLLAVVTFFLFGGAFALSGAGVGGVVPGPRSVALLAVVTVSGWKDLLTTLPPVRGDGQFLVLPYLLGLAAGATGFAWARRVPTSAAAVAVPAGLLVLVLLLGTTQPAAALLHGAAFTAGAFGWAGTRRRRAARTVAGGRARLVRGGLSAALVAAATGVAAAVHGYLPGADAGPRTVLRTYVQPPFDVTAYPSPLVGFRKYTEGARLVWDQDLLTVTGARAGTRVRFAVLDDYSGTVWAAGAPVTGAHDGVFRSVGTSISATTVPATGRPATMTFRVEPAYAGLADVDVWVPGTGYASRIAFGGPRAAALADSLRYSTDTGQGVVPVRFAAGDTITVTAAPVADAGDDVTSFGAPALASGATDVVAVRTTKWADRRTTPWEQLSAVANAMRSEGAYSDGTRPGETQYLPGHGVSRLTAFLAQPQLVGNDEQYAATFALAANHLGVPARVVLGAVVGADGVVRGRDVHAWVEVRGQGGAWFAVPQDRFMPDRDKRPTRQPPAQEPEAATSDVPPPNAVRPPGALDTVPGTRSQEGTPQSRFGGLPAWLVRVLTWATGPLALLLGVPLLLAGLRALRRRRRRRRGPGHVRLAQAWRDYVDHARDLGLQVPAGLTRREQARLVGEAGLAATADRAVFGAGDPDEAAVADYWDTVRAARRTLTVGSGRRRRLARHYSLRGLAARDPRPPAPRPAPATTQRRRLRRATSTSGRS